MKGLLFISHETEKYNTLQSIEIALLGGCRQIQLRMKEASLENVESIARQAKELCKAFKAFLYIDDHVEVCKTIRADGVHLGKLDMHPGEAREILGSDFIIGGTANTFEDIRQLANARVDYIGLGPFRFTGTKKNLSPILGLEGYMNILHQCRETGIPQPVLAIGGITKDDIRSIMKAGVSGIALSSTILQAENPVEETKQIVELIAKYSK